LGGTAKGADVKKIEVSDALWALLQKQKTPKALKRRDVVCGEEKKNRKTCRKYIAQTS
jgi:hypothetical protein